MLEVNKEGKAEDFAKKQSVLDAIHILAWAWRSVKATTIANCFSKAFSYGKGEEEGSNNQLDYMDDISTPPNMTRDEFEDLVAEDVLAGTWDEPNEDMMRMTFRRKPRV